MPRGKRQKTDMDAKKLLLAGYYRCRQYAPPGWLYQRDYFDIQALPQNATDRIVEVRLRHIVETTRKEQVAHWGGLFEIAVEVAPDVERTASGKHRFVISRVEASH
jgi:hypothetical protein